MIRYASPYTRLQSACRKLACHPPYAAQPQAASKRSCRTASFLSAPSSDRPQGKKTTFPVKICQIYNKYIKQIFRPLVNESKTGIGAILRHPPYKEERQTGARWIWQDVRTWKDERPAHPVSGEKNNYTKWECADNYMIAGFPQSPGMRRLQNGVYCILLSWKQAGDERYV